MFRKLRLKLTFINVAIILCLFAILIAGAYFFSHYEMEKRAAFVAARMLAEVQAGLSVAPPRGTPPGSPPGGPPGPPPGASFFFVKTAAGGEIVAHSPGLPLAEAGLATLTTEVLKAAARQGTVVWDGTEYSYVKAPLADRAGMAVVFHDWSAEKDLRRGLLTALMIVGAGCALLSFGASFVMAERAMAPIRRAWQQQRDFLSDASHELRSPLAVIQTNLEAVRINPAATVASQGKWLDNIQEEAAQMARLVDALLFLARAESEQQVLDRRPFSLNEAFGRAVAPFEAVAAAKGVTLAVASGPLPEISGDEARVRQVIGILLDNALRHTPAGGRVAVSLARTDAGAVLTVADTGEGIEPAHIDKIFDRFYQVDKARAKGGAGLGLAIARWIVEKHGGSITAASRPGEGATFTVRLPLDNA